jgi:hypothetical protein
LNEGFTISEEEEEEEEEEDDDNDEEEVRVVFIKGFTVFVVTRTDVTPAVIAAGVIDGLEEVSIVLFTTPSSSSTPFVPSQGLELIFLGCFG